MAKNNKVTPPPSTIVTPADLKRMQGIATMGGTQRLTASDAEAISISAMMHGIDLNKKATSSTIDYVPGLNTDYFNGEDIYSLDRIRSVDDIMYNNQSGAEVFGAFFGRTLNKAVTEVLKIPGFIGGIGMGLVGQTADFITREDNHDFMKLAFDNKWINTLSDVNASINESMPVYQSDAIKNGSFLDQVTSGTFWATEGADGIGYLLSAYGPGMLVKAAGLGGAVLRGSANVAAGFNRSRAMNNIRTMSRSLNGNALTKGLSKPTNMARTIDNAAITIANTTFEAGSEANHAAQSLDKHKGTIIENHIKDDLARLSQELESGMIDYDTFKERHAVIQAKGEEFFNSQRAALMQSVFLANAAILVGPNALQTRTLLNPAGKFLAKPKAAPNVFRSGGKGLLTGIFSEGFWEEGMQSVVENLYSDKAKKGQLIESGIGSLFSNTKLSELVEGYSNMITSVDGQKAVFLGSFLGGVMNSVGQYRSDKSDFITTTRIHTMADSVQKMMGTLDSLYKHDKNGNIVFDENKNPIVDIKKLTNRALDHLAQEQVSQIVEYAESLDNKALADYAKSLIAKDVATSFALSGEAGKAALLQYVEQHAETIKNNENLTEDQKEEALKELESSKELLVNHYTNMLADIQAYDTYSNYIIPSKESVGLTEDAPYNAFKQAHFSKYLQNRSLFRTMSESVNSQVKEIEKIFGTLKASEPEAIESVSKMTNNLDKLKAYEELDLLKPKIKDIRSLMEERDKLDKEYRDSINNPEQLLTDLKDMMGEFRDENYKEINRPKYKPIYEKIINATSESELNSITLPKELRELFKDEFVVAKAKRKDELIKKREEAKKNANKINENTPDTDPETIMSEVMGSNSVVIDHDSTVDYIPYADEGIVGEAISVDIEELEGGASRYVVTIDGYIIDTQQDPDELKPEGGTVAETAMERHNRLLEEQANAAVTTNQNSKVDEQVAEIPTEVASQNVVAETQLELFGNVEQQAGVDVKEENKKASIKEDPNVVPPVNLPAKQLTNDTVDEIPSETLEEYVENEAYNEATETETGKQGNVVINQEGSVTTKSITLRNPRAISYDTKGLNPELTKYVTNSKNKANDTFVVEISPVRSGAEHKFTVEARAVLDRIRKTGKYTINDYMTLLYKLPLTVKINGKISAPLDNVTERQIIEDPNAPGGIRLKENSSYNVMTAIPMRMQIINSLLSDPNAEIKLEFHKQLPGFLNTNRNIDPTTGKVVSIQSPVTTLKLPSIAKDPITYFVQNLAYVNHKGDVLGLSDGLQYTADARTSGIIYLRVPNLNGKMHNVQLSRRKIDNTEHDVPGYEGITKQGALAKIIYDAIFNFGNPESMFLSDFLAANNDNLVIINQLFPEALSIINQHYGSSATVADFINFFIHLSTNDVTRLQFKEGTILLGSLAREKTVLGSLMPEGHNYISFKYLFEEGFADERAAIFYEGFSQYIDLIKHNINKEYAQSDLPYHREYVEYIMNNVLTSDIKPGVDIFSNNVNTFVRTESGQFIVRDLKMDTDIYFEHKLPATQPGSSVFSYEEIYNNIDPLVRPFIHLSGLFDMNPTKSTSTPTKVSDSVNEQVEKEVKSAKVKKVEKPISTDAGVVVNTADTSIEDSVNPQLTIDFNQQPTTPTTPLQPSSVQLLASKPFKIGRTKYSVREMSDGSITIARRTNKGPVLLKKGSKTYQKVFALYNPEEALRQQIEKSIKRPSLQEAIDIISDLVTTNPDYLVLLYLAQGGTVSGKGFRHRKEKGLAWYEGRGKNKAPDNMVSDAVADHIFADYTATANYDAVDVRDSLEEAMLRISSRAEAKQRLIDAAHELLNQEALAQLHYLNEEEIRNYLQASERESVVEVYDNAERDANLESDEDIINSYYDSMLADLQELPIEEQIAIYEQWERESQEAQTNTSQTTTDDIEQQSTTESNTLVEVKEGVEELFNENPELALLGTQEQAKKFAELQERLNNKEFLEGAKFAYESTPELQQFGTQEEYNDYIARVSLGILPNQHGEYHNSQVKDIVYHGTDAIFEKFDKTFYQSGDPNYIYFGKKGKPGLKDGNRLIAAILNIKNPDYFIDTLEGKYTSNSDGFVEDYSESFFNSLSENQQMMGEFLTQYGVKEPEQIHILGSKQDVEGFKNYINTLNNEQKTEALRGNDQRATPEVYSSTESQENLSGTHEAPASIESIESQLTSININYEKMSNREQMKIVKELAIESGLPVDPATLRDASSRRELLDTLIKGARTANELTLLKNKICSF